MLNSKKKTSTNEVMTFKFSESQSQVRTLLEDGNVYFVGSDVAKTLGYKNPPKALKDHCRYITKRSIPHPQSQNKQIKVLTIPEGDVFRLIINSELESAQKFESWVMDEVLPSIRKKGYYNSGKKQVDFIDARDVVPGYFKLNNYMVTTICVEESKPWYNINDIHRAIRSTTGANQSAKKLNAKQQLAIKIHVYGGTHPSWFTNDKGLQLIINGSRNLKQSNQLNLPL